MKSCLKVVSAFMLICSLFLGCKGEIQYVDRVVEVEKTYAASVTFAATSTEGGVNVTMATATEGAKIYYSTDGTEPSSESIPYSAEVTISEDTTFKAIAVKEGIENSPVSYAKYSVVNKIETKIETKIEEKEVYVDKTYASPILFTAHEEEYGVSLVLSTETLGAAIYYTTDGSTPTASSTSYAQTLKIETNTTVKAIAIKQGIESSPVSVASVTIKKISQSSGGAGNPLQIALTADVPHENGYTGNKSNTKVTVTASITTASNVKKVVWKKDGSLIAKVLLADNSANVASVTADNSVWTLDITATDEIANGTYTVAAIDEAGREEAEQIVIDNFDFTPPVSVSGLTTSWSGNTVTLNWNNPTEEDFDHVEIAYTYIVDSSESVENQPINEAGTEKVITVKQGSEASAKIYTYYIKSVDKLGNKSAAIKRSVAVVEGVKAGYNFHEAVEYLPAGTDGTLGTNGTYVYFGDWPQTIKTASVTVEESQSMTMGGFTYYKGSDDNWYAKCTEDALDSKYTYSDGSTVAQSSSNSTKYFKVEPIKWRVLNPNATGSEKKILLAESILTKVPFYGGNSTWRPQLNGTEIKANNYKYSNIRAYLNGINNQFVTDGGTGDSAAKDWTGKGFLYSAFTASAINQIGDTEVDNSARSTNPASNASRFNDGENECTCDNTTDKIFLLSEQEVTNSDYGFAAENARIRVATDYAKANKAYQDTSTGYGGWWMLRSPGYVYNWRDFMFYVNSSGLPGETGNVNGSCNGVVPALCLK